MYMNTWSGHLVADGILMSARVCWRILFPVVFVCFTHVCWLVFASKTNRLLIYSRYPVKRSWNLPSMRIIRRSATCLAPMCVGKEIVVKLLTFRCSSVFLLYFFIKFTCKLDSYRNEWQISDTSLLFCNSETQMIQMELPFNIDVSCTEETEASFKLKRQDVFTVLMAIGFLIHFSAFFPPLKHLHFKSFRLVFESPLCTTQRRVGAIIGHIRFVTLVQGSPIGVKITKHLLYYTGVCPVCWVRGISSAEALEIWVQTRTAVSPFSLMYRLLLLVLSAHQIISQCFMTSLFLYCRYPLCPLIRTFSVAPVGVRPSKIDFSCLFFKRNVLGMKRLVPL